MTSKRGSKLSQDAVKLLEKVGTVINVIVAGESGASDLVACIKGRYVAIEIKGKGDYLKTLQSGHLAKVYQAGGIAIVAYNLEDVKRAIEWALRGERGDPPEHIEVKKITI